jgi:hypothetical protein
LPNKTDASILSTPTKFTREYVKAIFDNPEEVKRRTRYSYWVGVEGHPKGGYDKIVQSPDEVPKGKRFSRVICMG